MIVAIHSATLTQSTHSKGDSPFTRTQFAIDGTVPRLCTQGAKYVPTTYSHYLGEAIAFVVVATISKCGASKCQTNCGHLARSSERLRNNFNYSGTFWHATKIWVTFSVIGRSQVADTLAAVRTRQLATRGPALCLRATEVAKTTDMPSGHLKAKEWDDKDSKLLVRQCCLHS